MALLLEITADSADFALAAARAGADRLELCARLEVGGLTPPEELLRRVRAESSVPLVVLVRSRTGDFVLREGDLDALRRDVDLARRHGAEDVALGALRADGSLDLEALAALVAHAEPLAVCLHRAFDQVPDKLAAHASLSSVGIVRVLTSGGPGAALDHVAALRDLVSAEPPRIVVAGGVRGANVKQLARATGACELHSSAGGDPNEVAAMRAALDSR